MYPISPCVFIKKSRIEFVIIVMYVDDLNLIRTFEELTKIRNYLKRQLEMKYLRKLKI